MAEDLGIFQEIDDALRVDNMEKLLRQYGKLIIVVCVGIVLATAASVVWKNHMREVHMKQTAVLMQAQDLILAQKYPEAIKLLDDAMQKDSDFPTLGKLQRAAALMRNHESEKAQAAYSEIHKDSGSEKALRDMAALDLAIASGGAKQKIDTGSDQAFHSLASETQALELVAQGKKKEAHDLLENLASDLSLSPQTHEMAIELLDSMNGEHP